MFFISYKRVVVGGQTLNKRTADMLKRAESRLGMKLRIVQGSYNAGGVAASAGTHDGGGVLDIGIREHNRTVIDLIVLTLREVGFAAWERTPAQGFDPHIHAVALGDKELSSGAYRQTIDYLSNKNGLASHARDDGPRLNPIPKWPIRSDVLWHRTVLAQFKATKPVKKESVKRFQKALARKSKKKIVLDGIAGPQTRKIFRDYTGLSQPSKTSIRKICSGFTRVV